MGNIPLPALAIKPPEQQDILGQFGHLLQLKNAQQQMQQQQQMAPVQLQAAQQENQQRQMDIDSQRAVMKAYADAQGDLDKAIPLAAKYGAKPDALMKLKQASIQQQESNLQLLKAKGDRAIQEADAFQGAHDLVAKVAPEQRPAVYQQTLQQLAKAGYDVSQAPPEYPGDEAFQMMGLGLKTHSQQLKELASNADLQKTQAQTAEANAKANEANTRAKNEAPKTIQTAEGVFVLNPDGTKGARLGSPVKALQINQNSNGTKDDPKDIAAAIMRGDLPPTVKGLYRNASPVLAELGRQGYNLQRAESDWNAVQKHLSTLNGAQQERLRQAVTFTSDSLDNIEQLYDKWKKLGPNSGLKILNKAALATAKQLPGEAGATAQALEAQVNDLVSELGTVYKGGNASTDETLRLAAENLKADWNEQTFKAAIKQIRTNLAIRKNSILNSQPVGVRDGSPYSPTPQGEGQKPLEITLPSGKKITIGG